MKIPAFILLKDGKPTSPLELRRTRADLEYLKAAGEKVVKCEITYDPRKNGK